MKNMHEGRQPRNDEKHEGYTIRMVRGWCDSEQIEQMPFKRGVYRDSAPRGHHLDGGIMVFWETHRQERKVKTMAERQETIAEIQARLAADEEKRDDAIRAIQERYAAKEAAEKKAEAAAELTRAEERRAAKEAEIKEAALRSWQNSGGRAEAFESSWKSIYEDYLRREALNSVDEAVLAARRARTYQPRL